MFETHRALVHAFFEASAAGALPDDLLCEDMAAWTTTQGAMSRAAYQRVVTLLRPLCAEPISFIIDSITCEEDRAVAELHSQATLIDGSDYQNTYIFAFRFRDGKIAHVAEHFDASIVREKLIPLLHLNR